MSTNTSGGCLCGKVRFTVESPVADVSACHCADCRRWTSGPMHAVHVGPGIKLEGAEHLSWYDSSDWAQRGFCKHCGASLFYVLKGAQPDYVISAGAFDDVSALNLSSQIFIDQKPDYYAFAGDIPAMTGEEVFAMFAEQSSDSGEAS